MVKQVVEKKLDLILVSKNLASRHTLMYLYTRDFLIRHAVSPSKAHPSVQSILEIRDYLKKEKGRSETRKVREQKESEQKKLDTSNGCTR